MCIHAQGFELLRDLLTLEVPLTLNEALCEHHRRACPPSEQLGRECGKVGCPEGVALSALAPLYCMVVLSALAPLYCMVVLSALAPLYCMIVLSALCGRTALMQPNKELFPMDAYDMLWWHW